MLGGSGAVHGGGVGFFCAVRGSLLVERVDTGFTNRREDGIRDRVQVIDRVCELHAQRASIRGGDLGAGSFDLSQIVQQHLAGFNHGTVLGDTGLKDGRLVGRGEGVPAFEVLCLTGAGNGWGVGFLGAEGG